MSHTKDRGSVRELTPVVHPDAEHEKTNFHHAHQTHTVDDP